MKRVSIGDIELAVVDRGLGVPLLLVHGFPLDHSMWVSQIEGLCDTCRVIAPDLRGFGESDVTSGTVTMGQMADDIAALLDGLEVREPVVFCGLSMGGYIGWEFFMRHRDRVGSLILCDTRAICDTAEGAQGRRETAEKVVAEGPQILVDGMVSKLFSGATIANRKDIVEETCRVMMGTAPEGIAAAARGMAERIDASTLLASVDCPTLIVVGEEDAISTVEEMRSIADAIPGARFVKVAGAGHMSPLEAPAEVNEAIRQFVRNS